MTLNLYDASAYAVVFDSAGRIIRAGSTAPLGDAVVGPTKLKPGADLRVGFSISGPRMSHVTRAEVSIDR